MRTDDGGPRLEFGDRQRNERSAQRRQPGLQVARGLVGVDGGSGDVEHAAGVDPGAHQDHGYSGLGLPALDGPGDRRGASECRKDRAVQVDPPQSSRPQRFGGEDLAVGGGHEEVGPEAPKHGKPFRSVDVLRLQNGDAPVGRGDLDPAWDQLLLASLRSVRLGREGDAPGRWQRTRLLRCRLHNDLLIAELACVADRTAAEAMSGTLVGVPRAFLPPTDADEYYWADLVGLEVVNVREQSMGRILGLIDTPANTVFRVGDGQASERLLPFVAAVVLEVDLQAGRVRVDWELDW